MYKKCQRMSSSPFKCIINGSCRVNLRIELFLCGNHLRLLIGDCLIRIDGILRILLYDIILGNIVYVIAHSCVIVDKLIGA